MAGWFLYPPTLEHFGIKLPHSTESSEYNKTSRCDVKIIKPLFFLDEMKIDQRIYVNSCQG
jgi:hypothetical protein